MTTEIKTEADFIRDQLEKTETEDELLYWAATNVAGTIRDKLRGLVDQLDAIYEVLNPVGRILCLRSTGVLVWFETEKPYLARVRSDSMQTAFEWWQQNPFDAPSLWT